MIGFLLALLLWMLGAGPTPVPSPVHGVTVTAPAPASVAPASAHGGSRGPSSPSPAGRRSGGVSHLPQPTPAAPTVAPPAIATTDVDPGDGRMCLDPVDCPPGA